MGTTVYPVRSCDILLWQCHVVRVLIRNINDTSLILRKLLKPMCQSSLCLGSDNDSLPVTCTHVLVPDLIVKHDLMMQTQDSIHHLQWIVTL